MTPGFKAFLIGFLLITLAATCAEADTLYTGAWSTHIGTDARCETHNLVAYRHGGSGAIGGYFRNSYCEDTFFVAKQWRWRLGDQVHAGFMAGGVYGYRHCTKGWSRGGRKVCPMVSASLELDLDWSRPAAFLLGNALAGSPGWRLPW